MATSARSFRSGVAAKRRATSSHDAQPQEKSRIIGFPRSQNGRSGVVPSIRGSEKSGASFSLSLLSEQGLVSRDMARIARDVLWSRWLPGSVGLVGTAAVITIGTPFDGLAATSFSQRPFP